MLIDSTAFIDLMRKNKSAIEAFDKILHHQSASVITKLELIAGAKNKKEARLVIKTLQDLTITIRPINEDVSKLADEILTKYYHSHSIGIFDSFIGATALVYNEELVTRNIKHFNFIPNLKLLKPY